jgi:ATP-binding cassette subfamily C protein LapB
MSSRQEPFLQFEADTRSRDSGDAASADMRPTIEEEGAVDAIPELDAIGVDHDALLHSMAYLTRYHGNERSPNSLLDGMPVDGLLNTDQAVRVMRAAGYNAGLMQREIGQIHALLLPAVLLLKNGDACVLVKRFDAAPEVSPMCELVMPGPEFHVCRATETELELEYLGFALVATPQPAQAAGSGHREEPLPDLSGRWLWGTLRRFVRRVQGAHRGRQGMGREIHRIS